MTALRRWQRILKNGRNLFSGFIPEILKAGLLPDMTEEDTEVRGTLTKEEAVKKGQSTKEEYGDPEKLDGPERLY